MVLHLENVLAVEGIPKEHTHMALQVNLKNYSPNSVIFHMSPALRNILGEQTELEVPTYLKNDGFATYFHDFLEVLRESLSQVG